MTLSVWTYHVYQHEHALMGLFATILRLFQCGHGYHHEHGKIIQNTWTLSVCTCHGYHHDHVLVGK